MLCYPKAIDRCDSYTQLDSLEAPHVFMAFPFLDPSPSFLSVNFPWNRCYRPFEHCLGSAQLPLRLSTPSSSRSAPHSGRLFLNNRKSISIQ